MDLIKDVEVAYFRSVYKDRLSGCAGTNIIFGRNDSGKSNILRALNLFFNGETNPGQGFVLERDLNHSRKAEADEAADARKFVYVKIVFNTPPNWRASLGESFWVKRQWSVTTGFDPKLTHSIRDSRKEQYLTRFLNKVKFHYVPAIKDRRIFEGLQAEIYRVISGHEEFSDSLGNFAQALRDRTVELSQGLLNNLDIDSVVSTPQDLTDLFRSLDFETKTEVGDSYSLTLQRGDGIQVRHIPQILAFLSDRSSIDYHVWGFEEPENSLELASAIQEARTFVEFGQHNNKQVFLTSHSPAFFSLTEEGVERYFVSRTDSRLGRLNSRVILVGHDLEDNPSDLMGETPHLPVISAYLVDADRKIKEQQMIAAEFSGVIQARERPVVFVEGVTDKVVFEKAWRVLLGEEMPFDFESGGGTTKMESLGKDGGVLSHLAPGKKVFCLVDNDFEGRELFRNSRLDSGGRWVRHNSNGVYWCRLPLNPELVGLMTHLGIERKLWPGCLENFFSSEIRQRAEIEGCYSVKNIPHPALYSALEKVSDYMSGCKDNMRYYVLAPEPDAKESFAEWVVRLADDEPEIFEPLRGALEGLKALLVDGE